MTISFAKCALLPLILATSDGVVAQSHHLRPPQSDGHTVKYNKKNLTPSISNKSIVNTNAPIDDGHKNHGRDLQSLSLTSDAFEDGGMIPIKYTCDGENVSPPLAWEGVPSGTSTLALTIEDLTTPWNHWVVFNIPDDSNGFSEDQTKLSGTLEDGSQQGSNSFASIGMPYLGMGYGGMCPNPGDYMEHEYLFKLYALDTELTGLSHTTTKEDIDNIMNDGNVLEEAELRGTYKRGGPLRLDSDAFDAGGAIPVQNTCDGSNASPPLSWEGAPSGTESFALTVQDITTPWNHWVLYNVPPTTTSLPEYVPRTDELSDGSQQGTNSFGSIGFDDIATGYGGPCPNDGDFSEHTYIFRLYALDSDVQLSSCGDATKEELDSAVHGRILDQVELMATYQRDESGAAASGPPAPSTPSTPAPVAAQVTPAPAPSTPSTTSTPAPIAAQVTPAPVGGGATPSPVPAPSPGTLSLQSSAFEPGGAIPIIYTCDDTNISPPLSWTGTPDGTSHWAMTVEDVTTPWNHWVLYNVPGYIQSVPANIPRQPRFSDGSSQGTNSFGSIGFDDIAIGWGGPCPNQGDFNQHTYIFRLYALDSPALGLTSSTTKEELETAIADQTIGSTELMATYQRENPASISSWP